MMAEVEFATNPRVREFLADLAKQAKSTARLYGGFLYTYYRNQVRPLGISIDQWIEKVKGESKSDDVKIRTKWARDLETYLTDYVSEETGRPYTFKSRKVGVAAIRKFLTENIGAKLLEPYRFKLQSSEEKLAEEQAKDDFVPINVDEYRKLVLGSNNARNRAILLSLPGMGVGEWLQFAHGWFKYADAIRSLKVPIRVSVVRPKNGQHYSVLIWDDAVEHLRLLLLEREKELGHPLGAEDQLFISTYGDPITGHRVQHLVGVLRDRLGLEKKEKGKIIYKFRPHEIGRDFFRTLCENSGVSPAVAEYSLGHKIDQNEYNKFDRTPEGMGRMERE